MGSGTSDGNELMNSGRSTKAKGGGRGEERGRDKGREKSGGGARRIGSSARCISMWRLWLCGKDGIGRLATVYIRREGVGAVFY